MIFSHLSAIPLHSCRTSGAFFVTNIESVKLARHFVNTKKIITVPVAFFIVLQFLIKIKKSSAFFIPKNPK